MGFETSEAGQRLVRLQQIAAVSQAVDWCHYIVIKQGKSMDIYDTVWVQILDRQKESAVRFFGYY